ncbi:MAG TPA: hypothetical protein VGJ72_21175 [Polaromonas sp.]|jgi:hypothetical protein
MKKLLLSAAFGALAASCVLPSMAADGRIDFNGGIGSQPFASAGGAVVANDVRGVQPGGRPWVIGKLRAAVRPDGSISVKGEGLVLGGGNAVGTPAIPRQVVATLFCGATELNSAAVDLDANGDFVIRSPLSGALPNPCATPTLLIRNFAAGVAGPWFAAGILEN